MVGKATVLTVNHNRHNLELLAQVLVREGYHVLGAATAEEFDQTVDSPQPIAAALVDVTGFGQCIWQVCNRLHQKGVPFVILCREPTATLQQQGLAHGARAVLVKPLVVSQLLELVQSLVENS